MIHDATIEVTCDKENCEASIEIYPEYVYTDYSGNNGHYDCSGSAINKMVAQEGWVVDGDEHFCYECQSGDE
jgi:hypothetical protein